MQIVDSIRSDIKDLADKMNRAYSDICDKAEGRDKSDAVIVELKQEIETLQKRKVNVVQSVKDESAAAAEKKKEHTAKKNKYRALIKDMDDSLAEQEAKVLVEVDKFRIREMGAAKAEKAKINDEMITAKNELAKVRAEFTRTTKMLQSLKEGIKV